MTASSKFICGLVTLQNSVKPYHWKSRKGETDATAQRSPGISASLMRLAAVSERSECSSCLVSLRAHYSKSFITRIKTVDSISSTVQGDPEGIGLAYVDLAFGSSLG